MTLRVVAVGPLATIQDPGRPGHGAGRHPGPGHRQAGYREADTVAEQVTESGCEAGELHPPHLLRMPRDDLVGRDTEVGGDGAEVRPVVTDRDLDNLVIRRRGHDLGRQVEAAQRSRHLDQGSRTGDGDEHGASCRHVFDDAGNGCAREDLVQPSARRRIGQLDEDRPVAAGQEPHGANAATVTPADSKAARTAAASPTAPCAWSRREP